MAEDSTRAEETRGVDASRPQHAQRPKRAQRPKDSKRFISLAPSHTEWIYELGASGLLVGRTDQCDHPPEVSEKRSVGSLFPPQLERLIAVQPTDALMISGNAALKVQLERFGVKVHTLQPRSLEELFEQTLRLGELLGRDARAASWVARAQSRLRAIAAQRTVKSREDTLLKAPRVLVEVWYQPLQVAGAESFIGDVVRAAGGEVSPSGRGAWPKLSLEELTLNPPDVIFVSTQALYHLLTRPLEEIPPPWRSLSAVRARRVYLLDGRLARPGPRVIDDVSWVASRLNESRDAR